MSKSDDRPKRHPPPKRARVASREAALRAMSDLRGFFSEQAKAGDRRMQLVRDVLNALINGLEDDPASLERLARAARRDVPTNPQIELVDPNKSRAWDNPTVPFPRPESEQLDIARVMRDGIHDVLADAARTDGDAKERARDAADFAARWVSAILFDDKLGHGLGGNRARQEGSDRRASDAARAGLEHVEPNQWGHVDTAESVVRACLREYGVSEQVVSTLFVSNPKARDER